MANKKQNSDLFDKVKKTTNVSEKDLRSLANQVTPEDLKNEKNVRQLIAQIAALAGVSVSKEKEDQIVNYLVKNQMSLNDMQAMIQMFVQGKK